MKELTMAAERACIPRIIDFVNGELECLGCPAKTMAQIDIAIDEIFSNIANYGYDAKPGTVTVAMEPGEGKSVSITFMDDARPFNPLERADPDVTLPALKRKIGGLGIYMVKKSMDDVRYEYRDGKNVLTIRKTI
jgi:anti-sigma regulatory factor (Ser/Thr protein kinase)